jgi:hypothetical protein
VNITDRVLNLDEEKNIKINLVVLNKAGTLPHEMAPLII